MKKIHISLITIVLLILWGINYFKGSSSLPYTNKRLYKQSVKGISEMIPVITVASNPNSQCHINGVIPDSNCTPGAIDPRVTQNNIFQTICVQGYTKTVRPPVGYTDQLKLQQIQQYGYIDANSRNYEEDHLISLELGGNPTDPKNLWPEPGASPNPKDDIENRCHEKVCAAKITLAEAQKEISTNWTTACQ